MYEQWKLTAKELSRPLLLSLHSGVPTKGLPLLLNSSTMEKIGQRRAFQALHCIDEVDSRRNDPSNFPAKGVVSEWPWFAT
jgi:hypothetical protein